MRNRTLLVAAVSSALLLSGCDEGSNSGKAVDKPVELVTAQSAVVVEEADIVATVNGEVITVTELEQLSGDVAQRTRADVPRERLIEELVSRELLFQDAEKKKLAQQPDVAESLTMVRQTLLSQAAVQDFIEKNPVTDEEIKKAYDEQHGKKSTEYNARHILVKTEDEAKAVTKKLKGGAKFEDLAKTTSIGPTKTQGGSLGWFSPGQMVPEFGTAVAKLKKGAYSEPIKTQFGWHVILLEDSREKEPPTLEQVKPQLSSALQREKLQKYIDGLRGSAKVVIKEVVVEEVKVPSPDAAPASGKPPAGDKAADSAAAPVTDKPAAKPAKAK